MEIFKDSPDSSNSNYDSKYNQIIYNQVNYNPKNDLRSNNQEKETSSENQNHDNSSSINQEVLNGNFIKSIVFLYENKISINDIYNEEGDTLLHLACKFSDFNVIKTLIEKFGADINKPNNNNITPFYIVCDTRDNEQEIISYFFKQKNINYDIEDKKGINPLILSIKNKNMNLFYALCSIGCDLNHKDNEFHDIYYYAIKYDNLPALQYLLKFSQVDLFSSNNNLTPILVTSEGSKCCKYLFKYHYHKVINGITQPLSKESYKQEEFNLFNYEIVNTCYNQMKFNFIMAFFKILISDIKYNFKLYNIKFLFLHLVLRKTFTDHAFRRFSFIYYCFMLFLYTYFYIDFRQFLFNFSDIISLITSIICVILCYNLLVKKTHRKIEGFYNKYFNFSYDKKKDSLLGICEDSLKDDILNLPGTGEACARCLVKKTRNIQHCNKCDLCVKNYFFHSNLLGICVNSDNALNYSLLNFIFSMKLFTFISLLYSLTIESKKMYISFSFYKFIGVIIGGNLIMKVFGIFLFINAFMCLGISLTTFLCLGYNASYYLTYKQHEIPYGRILQRKIYENFVDYLAPLVNLIHVPSFWKNIIYRRDVVEYV